MITTRIPLAEASAIATELTDILWPGCERITVAGSVRRNKPDCHDVELVVIPRMEVASTDLFGEPAVYRNTFDDHCAELRESGVLADRLDKNGRPAFGEKYKRLIYQGIPVDLFSATPENYGLILALRTGPAEFNLKLVQPAYKGGFLPMSYRVDAGYLWRGDQRIDTPEEIDVFNELGLAWIEPHDRR